MSYAITDQSDARFRAREARVSFALTRAEFLSRRLRFDSSFTVYIVVLLPAPGPDTAPKIEHQRLAVTIERCRSITDQSVAQVT